MSRLFVSYVDLGHPFSFYGIITRRQSRPLTLTDNLSVKCVRSISLLSFCLIMRDGLLHSSTRLTL